MVEKMNKKRIILRLAVALLFFSGLLLTFFCTWQSGVTIQLGADTTTSLNVFYDNGAIADYRFDDNHMSSTYNVNIGEQSIYVPIPVENMNRLRIDFGTIPSTISLSKITLHVSPYQEYIFSGEALKEYMPVTNDIENITQDGDVVVYQVTGQDGFIAAKEDLLGAVPISNTNNALLWGVCSILAAVVLAFIDVILRYVVGLCVRIVQNVKNVWNSVCSPQSFGQIVGGIALCLITAVGIALLIDGVILKLIYWLATALSMDTLSRYFTAGQNFSLIRAVFFFNIVFVGMLVCWLGKKKAVRWRYLLAGVLLVLMTIGKYTGSSLGFYDGMLMGNTDEYDCSTLLGIPQGIRGDEWATEKPYYFAQVNGGDDLPYYNYNMMLEGADMVVHAFAPVKDIITLFRPSLLGFLFLPAENAFAFYWWAKLIALFMASFEICRLLSNKVKYGVFGAIIISCAPAIRWWLSQSSTEIYIYGFFALVCYSNYLNSRKKISEYLLLIGVFYFLTCYIFTIYPACQVPMAYIMLAIVIWITYKNWDKNPFSLKRIACYIIATIPFAAIIIRFLIMSGPALKKMLNTVYPGTARPWVSLDPEYPLYQLINPFTAIIQHPNFSNSCEISQFYCFAAVLIPLVIWLTYRYRKKMLLPSLLCGMSTFLLVIAWMPQIPFLNKATLLSMSYPVRILIPCGIGYTWTIISLLPMMEQEILGLSRKKSIIFSSSAWMFLLIASTNSEKVFQYFLSFRFGTFLLICIITIFCFMGYLLMQGGKKACISFMGLLCALNFISTICIDPITFGTDSMFEKTTMQEIRRLDDEDSGRWMVSGSPTIGNLVTAQGVARVSGTYYYPDWEMMEIIDPIHEFEQYWNQFAHIDMRLTIGDNEISILDYEKSEKVDGTNRIVYINIDTAKELGVKYIFTCVGVPEELVEDGQLKLVYDDPIDTWDIYKIID